MKRQHEQIEGHDARPSTAAAHDPRYAEELERRLAIVEAEDYQDPARAEEVILYADLDTARIAAEPQTFDSVGHYSRPDVFDLTANTAPRGHLEAT